MSTRRRSTFVTGDAPGADAGADLSPEVPALPLPRSFLPVCFARPGLHAAPQHEVGDRTHPSGSGTGTPVLLRARRTRANDSRRREARRKIEPDEAGRAWRTMDACCFGCLGLNGAI